MPKPKIKVIGSTCSEVLTEEESSCTICSLDHSVENCPVINSSIIVVKDSTLPTKAFLTLPNTLICNKLNNNNYQIISRFGFSKGTQFGPLTAPRGKEYNPKCKYPLKLFKGKDFDCHLDTSDENLCNWMILVPFNSDPTIRNCICYQHRDVIYFSVVSEIKKGDQLILSYSPGYKALVEDSDKVLKSSSNEEKEKEKPSSSLNEPVPCLKLLKTEEKLSTLTSQSQQQPSFINDHDYIRINVNESNLRRSGRKRKIVKDSDFVFEKIKKDRIREEDEEVKVNIIQIQNIDTEIEVSNFKDESEKTGNATQRGKVTLQSNDGTSVTYDVLTYEENNFEGESENDDDEEEDNKNSKPPREKLNIYRPRERKRLGLVHAYDEWKCKFCQKLFSSIPLFASHLIDHYKRVGAARTEKSRIEKESNGDEELVLGEITLKEEPSDIDVNKERIIIEETEPKFPYFCDICVKQKIFNRAEYVIRHLKNHAGENNSNLSKDIFNQDTATELEEEKKVPITNSKCNLCGNSTFRSYKSLIQHLEIKHGKSYKCENCEKQFISEIKLDLHRCKCKGKRDSSEDVTLLYKCDLCSEIFSKKTLYDKHISTAHDDLLVCNICNKTLSIQTFKTHTQICTQIYNFTKGEELLKCPKCTIMYENDVDSFRYHMATHTHPFMCPNCNLRLSSSDDIKSHDCQVFYCDGCSLEFDNLVLLKKHITLKHGKIEFYCFECALPFLSKDGYASHKGCEVDNFRKDKKTKKKEKEDGLYICDRCGAQYTKWSSLKTHRYTHGEKRYICTCGKSFHRKEMLADHQYVHSLPQFECHICNKKLKSKKSLDVHLQIHMGIKKFQCSDCGRSFTQKINLMTHQLIHLPFDKRSFECGYCQKKFSSKEYLGFHIEAHVKGKNEVCEICNKSFVKLHMLNQHKRITHGNHRYNCEFCDVIVRQKHSLTRHLTKRHLIKKHVWSQEGYMDSRLFIPGDESSIIFNLSRNSEVKNEKIAQTLQSNNVQQLPEQIEIVGNEEITFTSEEMGLTEQSRGMMILVQEGGEIIFTLANPNEAVEDGNTIVGI